MAKKLSYPKIEIPYQSCWLIITKALLINRIGMQTVLRNYGDGFSASNLGILHENLVFDLSEHLQLSSLTLTQASISKHFQSSSQGRLQAIRHCQDCIDLNYHSSLFQNPLLERCPVHNSLLKYCQSCTTALRKGGSLFARPLLKNSACQHLTSLSKQRVPMVKLSAEALQIFEVLGDKHQRWIDSVERFNLGSISDVMPKISGAKDLEMSEFYFEYVRRRIGLPFDLYWQSMEFAHAVSRIDYTLAASAVAQSKTRPAVFDLLTDRICATAAGAFAASDVTDVIKCVKSLRRFLFKRYVRQHRRCFHALRSLSEGELHNLCFSSRCTCASAYCAWLVSSGGVSSMREHQAVRSSLPMRATFEDLLSSSSLSLRDILVTQFVSFFDVWGALETADDPQKPCSDVVIARALLHSKSFVCMNASYTLTHRNDACGRVQKLKSFIISPGQLITRSEERCFSNTNAPRSGFVDHGSRDLFGPSAQGIMRFGVGRCDFRNTLVISIW